MVSRPYNGFSAAFRDKQGGKVYRAFRDGKLERPTECTLCHLTTADGATIQAHNEDYHEPFTFIGICFYCHMAVHKRFGSGLNAWHEYRRAITRGWQPPRNRDYRRFVVLWDELVAGKELPTSLEPDYTNWSWLLPDHEPDLYTERAREQGSFLL